MNEQTISIEIPQPLYQRLQRLAELTNRPVSNLVVQALDQNVPPLLDDLPPQMQQELLALNSLSDDELWVIARSSVGTSDSERYSKLLDKERSEALAEEEVVELEELYHQFNVQMLQKAYAVVLLKWRGYAVLSPLHDAAA